MPTPSDSTDELLLPSQIEHSLHSSCPPEIDRPAEWRAQVLDRLPRVGYQPDAAVTAVTVNVDDESSLQPPRLDTNEDQPAARALDTEANVKRLDQVATMDVDTTTPTMASDSPPSCQVEEKQIEEKEEEQAPTNTRTSSILDLPYSTRLGLYNSRVCCGAFGASKRNAWLIQTLANPNLHLLHATTRKQISGHAAVRCVKI